MVGETELTTRKGDVLGQRGVTPDDWLLLRRYASVRGKQGNNGPALRAGGRNLPASMPVDFTPYRFGIAANDGTIRLLWPAGHRDARRKEGSHAA